MDLNVVALTKELVSIPSISRWSNVAISERLRDILICGGFEVEWLEFSDVNGERKVSLVARKGTGSGGLGFFSHSDTVPDTGWERAPFAADVENDYLTGLGSCDMKGPLAATIAAAVAVDEHILQSPVYIVITADEEITGLGARQVAQESALFRAGWPQHGVIAEPTQLLPIYAHKGSGRVIVTARGVAAHTSTDLGISSNMVIAPFLAEVAEFAKLVKSDPSFQNPIFNPPTNGFNFVLDDGGCKPNITPAKTVCTISFRPMPDDRSQDIVDILTRKATAHGLEVTSMLIPPFQVAHDAPVLQAALQATGASSPGTVSFGSDSVTFRHYVQLTILGPGHIADAHTIHERISVEQLYRAQEVYQQMIYLLCTNPMNL